ncbi:MAG: glycosyltransferase [Flavobacteriales bacterium]|nr:glycosyltransferase [Flavobacteriales bacterium]
MELLIFIASTIVFLYCILILLLIAGFYRVPEETYETASPISDFTVIVPFRNEEDNIEKLIGSLSALEYPIQKFEVVFVDDNSVDSSYRIVETLLKYTKIRAKVIQLPDNLSGKKAALNYAISQSLFPWIITTDADCTVQPLWLKLFDQKIQSDDVAMLAGPVSIKVKKRGFIYLFQQWDLAAMMGSTIGGFGLGRPFLSNGANLAFRRDVFREVDGYEGNFNVASGDDIFLMEKFVAKYPNRVKYIKSSEAIVSTNYVDTFRQFINQRVRWASKSVAYNSMFISSMGFMVGISNLLIGILLVLVVLGISLDKIVPFIFLKFFVDFWMVMISSSFLGSSKSKLLYPLVAFTYPLYVVGIAVLSQTTSYEWKGRVEGN